MALNPAPEHPGAHAAPGPASPLRIAIRNVLALGAGELAARAIGFLCTLWVARRLGSEAYGIIGFAFTLSLYAAIITDFGLEQHGARETAGRRHELGTLIASVIAGRLCIALVTGTLMAVAGTFAPATDGRVLALYALVLLPAATSVRWAHLGLQRAGVAGLARLLAETLRLLLLVLTVSQPAHLARVPLAQLAGDLAGAALLFAALRPAERTPFRIDLRLALSVFRRARPLFFAGLLGTVIYNSDILILRFLQPVASTGLYLAAYAPINLLGVLGNVVAVSLIPALARAPREDGSRGRIYEDVSVRLSCLTFPVAAGGFLLASPVISLGFGPEYRAAGPVLAILIWTFPLLVLRSIQHAALIASDAHADVLRTTAWAAAVNLGLNIIVIPIFGMIGAAATTLAAEAVRLVLTATCARRSGYRFPAARKFSGAGLAVGAMAAGLLLTTSLPVWIRLAAGAAILAAIAPLCLRSAPGSRSVRHG